MTCLFYAAGSVQKPPTGGAGAVQSMRRKRRGNVFTAIKLIKWLSIIFGAYGAMRFRMCAASGAKKKQPATPKAYVAGCKLLNNVIRRGCRFNRCQSFIKQFNRNMSVNALQSPTVNFSGICPAPDVPAFSIDSPAV